VTVDDLAREIATTHGIDTLDAAREVVQIHVGQVTEDPDLWNAQTRELTAIGADLVRGAVAESYAQSYHATAAQQLVEDIADEAAAIEAAERAIAEHTARRDELIRAALRTELPRAAIAAAAGVKEARLYQIRDGRR
jgi:hypothetical protein